MVSTGKGLKSLRSIRWFLHLALCRTSHPAILSMLLKAFLRLLFVLNRRIFRECIRAVYLPLRTTIGPETSENTSILFELFSDTQWLLETLVSLYAP